MIKKRNRAGTSQDNKSIAALQPGYVAVEERSTVDLLMYLRDYAEKVRFYDKTNQWGGEFWTLLEDGSYSGFLGFSNEEILELAEFAENPSVFSDDAGRLSKYSKPHLALLLTFLKLLQYPQELFAGLTEKNVEFFYRDILKLESQAEVPDQVHVIFNLARDVREYLLTKGTLLNAGKDNTGADLHYEVTEDVVLNNAQVSDVKTIHFSKEVTNLKYIHQNNNQGDAGFEKMLCLVLGNITDLPPYITASGRAVPVNAVYLRTELYERIKGKERDELEPSDAAYIFQSLCFRSLKEFMTCLNLLYREINHGYVGVTAPADSEWEEAYSILEEVHRERIARSRRDKLKDIYQKSGFEGMMEYAFGEPEPGDMLYKMPAGISILKDLANSPLEAARQYIENKLCMTVTDFRTVFAQKDSDLTGITGDEVYAILEAAWTKKRGYHYPEIGAEIITGFYADTIYNADEDQSVERFSAFGKSANAQSSETIDLGFAVSSPLLQLREGNREINMYISCKEGSIDYKKISALLAKNQALFTTSLSVTGGWRKVPEASFETGQFIIKPELKSYDREDTSLICDITEFTFFDQSYIGTYIGFANGKVYQIEDIDEHNREIQLKVVKLEHTQGSARLIKRLKPKTFVAELKASLTVPRYALNVQSAVETFDQYYQGKYLVDRDGTIFLITRFISASEVEVDYCGAITAQTPGVFDENDRLLLNKVWETVELDYEEINARNDISELRITQIYSAQKDFIFEVSDGVLKISYPEGATAQQLFAAWEAWRDVPGNDPGRYAIKGDGSAQAELSEFTKELEPTGEVIKRYESPVEKGICVTYRGRPIDPVNLIIAAPSATNDRADFLISGDTLTITPGRISRTANQIAADWRLWLEDPANLPQGFQVDSKDSTLWQALPVSERELSTLDKQVKKCELSNYDGVGIRVWYTGPVADRPRLVLQENTIDLFEFERGEDQILTIKYPSLSETSAHDLLDAWTEWTASEINDPGNFDLEMLGDGLWDIQARSEKELQASENQVIECTCMIDEDTPVGITARYKISGEYQNAVIQFVKHKSGDANPNEFVFSYSDVFDEQHDYAKTKVLTVTYPSLDETIPPDILPIYRERHLQTLLSKWNREYKKQGFSLIRTADDAQWPLGFPDLLRINFRDALNYVCTIDPDGFVVKYRPQALPEHSQFTEMPRARVVIHENDAQGDAGKAFAFQLTNDYPNNLKILFIKYPTTKKLRTVTGLIDAWEAALLVPGGDKLSEFTLVACGTKEWEITGITSIELNAAVEPGTWITDPIRQRFYEYKTSDVNGFTLYYSGPEGTHPLVTMAEHEQDTFKFNLEFSEEEFYDVAIGEKLTINYPKRSDKRGIVDLITGWHDYQDSFLDGGPTLRTHAEQELVSPENGIIECTVAEADIIAGYRPTEEYPSAVIEFVANTNPAATKFSLAFSDVADPENSQFKNKLLTITYPTLPPVTDDPIIDSENQTRHVQALLTLWSEQQDKQGFSLTSRGDAPKWARNFETTSVNFKEDFNYTRAIEPDGYIVKYKPAGLTAPFTEQPQARVASCENTSDAFAFQLVNDYENNRKLLFIKYPTVKKYRTVAELLKAWTNESGSLLETGSPYWQKDGELGEFELTTAVTIPRILGFEIVDTSSIIEKRAKSELLTSGDLVREYHREDNDICISYIGHRVNPMVVIEPIRDFNDSAIGKQILWENGEVFPVTGWRNKNQVTVGSETKIIPSCGAIKLYAADAICFETLKFTIRLDADFPPVVPLGGADFAADPTVKILLKRNTAADQQDSVADFYDCFRTIYAQRIDLQVAVKGLQDLKLRGNIAMINPSNPFLPFGQTPDQSARFYFTNPEICEKKLDSLQLNLNWVENEFLNTAGLPDMEQYYYTYSHSGLKKLGTIKNEDFEVKLKFLDQRAWVPISTASQCLFSKAWLYNDFSRQTYQGPLFATDQVLPKDPLDWPRYYELDLYNQGFMKDFYPELTTVIGKAARDLEVAQNNYDTIKQEIKSRQEQIKAAKLAEAEARESGANYYLPVIPEARELPELPENDRDISKLTLNPPYTPVVQSLSIDYTASALIMLNHAAGSAETDGVPVQLFRFNLFGYEEMGKAGDEDEFLLPQYDQEGYLMIGIQNLKPLETVSLLFQMVAGSGDVNLATPKITWSYLSDNKWLPFKQSEILKDRTFGLQDTGIVQFSIPAAATTGNTLLPGNRCWIRAEAPENIAAVPDILDVRARAVCLTYLNLDNDPDHLAKPLAAGSITDMTVRESVVKEVVQPYSSFDGKRAEINNEFYTRVSERLKHKNRALTLDDYEQLILGQFPQIYKVKCVPQDELELFEPSSQGEVVVIVILKNSNATPFFPLKPKTPVNLLGEIETYIKALMPPQVKVTVRNPRFEEVCYRLAVKFSDGFDQGFYINKIIEDIKRYLSPWAYDKEAEINFGTSIYSSSLINYLENQSYVDYIANFNPLQQSINHGSYNEVIQLFLTDDNEVSAKYPDSIVVSADSHIIDVITTEFFDPGAFRGIGHMKIETDFWIDRPGAIFSVGLGQMELEAWPVMRHAFTAIPVTVTVSAVVRGHEYPAETFITGFSRADSQQIWDTLRTAGFLDEQGNVVTDKDLYADDFHLLGAVGSFEDYLISHLSGFSFQIKASDFDATAGRQDEFSYRVEELDTTGLETAVVNLIKAGLGFDGRSQYPFIIY